MQKWILLVILCAGLLAPSVSEARGRIFGRRGGYSQGTSYGGVPAGHSNATCSGVAKIMASLGRVGHFGGHQALGCYEGCGSGSTAQQAYNNCCYSTSRMATVDAGYAQASNGQWYCCRRYR